MEFCDVFCVFLVWDLVVVEGNVYEYCGVGLGFEVVVG